jgi:hypothetical protein
VYLGVRQEDSGKEAQVDEADSFPHSRRYSGHDLRGS